jgi:UMF1 family MFS transporter
MVATVTTMAGSPRLGMAMIILFLAIGMVVLIGAPYPASRPAR